MLIKNLAATAAVIAVGVCGTGVVVQSATRSTGRPVGNPPSLRPIHKNPDGEVVSTIVIDPGHGGSDFGASVNGVNEKDLALALATQVRDDFQARHWKVVMTRDSDTEVSISQRVALTKAAGAQYFLSLHCDVSGKPNSHEGITGYYNEGRQDDYKLAMSVVLGTKDGPFHQGNVHSDSIRFATGFGVLRMNTVPAVLIECGYMNNGEDLRYLKDPASQAKIARGIVDGFINFTSDPRATSRNKSRQN